jgi:hypothetical protein
MTLSSGWNQEYRMLKDFIAAHSEIVIAQSEVSIPQEFRDEFYRRFDQVRSAIVADHYASLPEEIGLLCENYLSIEKEIKEALGLESIVAPVDLLSFLHNPKEGLVRIYYNRLFDMLQGKITPEAFELQAKEDLVVAAADLYRLGYELWSALMIIKLLEPDQSYLVDFDEDYEPLVGNLTSIAFGRQAHHPTLRIPEFVIHSRKLNQYVAVKMALAREIESYAPRYKPAVKPRKKTGDTSYVLDSRVMLLYFLPDLKKIPVIADIYESTLKRPDWMMEFISGSELKDAEAWNQVEQHREKLLPKLGVCLMVVNPGPIPELEGFPNAVLTIAAGFNRSKLQSLVDAMVVREA